MECFKGAAIYTKQELKTPLDNFLSIYKDHAEYLEKLIREVEKEYKPFFLIKVFKGNTLKARWKKSEYKTSYYKWLWSNGFLELTESDNQLFHELGLISYSFSNGDLDTFREIMELASSGKDCYLNIEQIKFMNKYKEK